MSNDTEGGSLWSSLPDFAKEVTYDYEGNVMLKRIRPKYIPDIMDFKVRPDDTFLISFPKSGTTWVQRIICLILEGSESNKTHLFEKVPFLEMPQGYSSESDVEPPGMYEIANNKPSPRFMKTHLRMKFLPREMDTKKPKIVYVARNPKDNAVSYFNFCSLTVHFPKYKVWSEFLRDFQRGAIPRGSWFEHVLGWWQKRNEPNVLFLKYEDLQKNLPASVVQIAEFLGQKISEETIEDICNKSSFTSMRNDPMTNPDFIMPSFREGLKENRSFLRKGTVGDWKNYFTVAQSEEFDALYKEKMEDSGLRFDFTLE